MTTSSLGGHLRRLFRQLRVAGAALQREFAGALGIGAEQRTATVIAMLASNARRAPGYWIQLTLAMGIATLGLVLGSTAVVIGAMLVSPLMGPIVELGMGFATGSSLLVIRSFLRVALSVVWVIVSAALIVLLLPFHEVTGEIAARTAPTALDLLVAVFCALTAAYTTVRAASDTTAAAAGTAIGIALVPPLCVVGYGLGTASGTIASGALLLFTANFSAILVFAVLSFLLLGYNEVDAEALEQDYVRTDDSRTERVAERANRRLRALFGSRYGRVMRLLVPATILLIVYVPLGRALDEVAWQVRVRSAVQRLLADESGRIVQTALTVERHTVALRLLMLGTAADAAALERQLATRIAAASAVEPTVRVLAVPDAEAMAALAMSTRPAVEPVAATPDLALVRQRIAGALAAEWPTSAVGALLGWRFELEENGDPLVRVVHQGAPLGEAGAVMLAQRVRGRVGMGVRVQDVALPVDTLVAGRGDEEGWAERVALLSEAVAATPRASLCVQAPARARARPAAADRVVVRTLERSPAARAGRLTWEDGRGWSARVVTGTCARAAADSTAAGAPVVGAAAGAAAGTTGGAPAAR